MKSYTITVNGTVYNVTVEEGMAAAPAPLATPVASAPAAAPKSAPAPAPAAAPAAAPKAAAPKATPGAAGAEKITASVPGKIVKIDAPVGTNVKSGDSVVVLEAMKMEIPVVAPKDGVVKTIDVSVGDTVETGDLLATFD